MIALNFGEQQQMETQQDVVSRNSPLESLGLKQMLT